jgi:hypothetical protein
MVHGLPLVEQVDQVCDGCLVGKQQRSSFPAQARRRADSVLELVHRDLCGPITPATPSGNKYFLLLVDDMSRFMWIRLLSSKDQAPWVIKNFQAAVEVETGKKLMVLRTDRGGGVHVGGVWSTLRRARCAASTHRPVFAAAKRGGGTTQSEHRGHGSVYDEDKATSRLLLG